MFKFIASDEGDTTSQNDLADNETSHEDDASDEGDGQEKEHDSESAPETVTLTKAELDKQLEERERAARKDQDKRWKERIRNSAKDEEDADGEDISERKEGAEGDRLDRMELRSEGVKDAKEQDIVISYARYRKISVLEALEAPAVKAELKQYQDKSATPSPSRRTNGGNRTDDVEYWAEQWKKGVSAPTLEMRRKVRKHLQRR